MLHAVTDKIITHYASSANTKLQLIQMAWLKKCHTIS